LTITLKLIRLRTICNLYNLLFNVADNSI
jgi:hypothetical protein